MVGAKKARREYLTQPLFTKSKIASQIRTVITGKVWVRQ